MENTRVAHYQVGRRLGRGGMGEVYEALDLDLDRRVALKFVAPELAADPDAILRFEREARSAAALKHSHIATLFAFERVGDRSFIAMELVSGGSVRDRMRGGPLPVVEALTIARDVADALALAHRRGIIHRDVKPENLMFDEDGVVKLTDFGLARATEATRLTMAGKALGTAAYMPPESLRGAAEAPGDVFALGVTLHEMLAGELPFTGDSALALLYSSANEEPKPLREARPEAPEAVAGLVARMLAKAPLERPDAATVARELAAITGSPRRGGAGDTADLMAALEAVRRHDPRRAVHVALLLGGAVVLGILIIVVIRIMAGQSTFSRSAIAFNNRGLELIQLDSLDAARVALEAALREDPDYPEAKLNLALVLQRAGDPTAAATLYGQVARKHAGKPALAAKAHFRLAEIDMAAGALPSAIEHYREALARDSTNAAYPNYLALALIRASRPNEAGSVLVRALERFPGEAMLHKNLGLARLRAGKLEGAVQAFDTALDRDPALASAWGFRAEAKAKLHDLAGARSDWQTYINMAHDESERPAIEAQLRRLGAL